MSDFDIRIQKLINNFYERTPFFIVNSELCKWQLSLVSFYLRKFKLRENILLIRTIKIIFGVCIVGVIFFLSFLS